MRIPLEELALASTSLAVFAACGRDVAVGGANIEDSTQDGGTGAGDGGSGEILASGQQSPEYLAVDRTNVYWANAGNVALGPDPCDGGGSIVKVPIGGGTPVVLAAGQNCPVGIAVDDTNVYWTNNIDNGSVATVPIAGGPPVTLAAGQTYPTGIAVNATDVYWVNDKSFVGPSPSPIASVSPKTGSVMRMALDAGAPTVLVPSLDSPFALALDETSVYFTVLGNSLIEKTSLVGGAPLTLASSQYGHTSGAIAVDGTSIYSPWSPVSVGGCNPAKIPLDGGPPVVLGTSVSSECGVAIYGIATDGVAVYWTQEEGPGDGGPVDLGQYGVVKKVPVTDGVPVTLARGLALPRGIAVDATSVYWANAIDGTIRKTAK